MLLFARSLLIFIAITLSPVSNAKKDQKVDFSQVMENYSQGKYQASVDLLAEIEKKLQGQNVDKKTKGLIAYWKGMANNRLQRYSQSIEDFRKAKELGFEAADLSYEYGQALFAADKLLPARIQFNESFKKGFKRGTCLYYMAFISKELGETDNAKSLFSAVKKLPDGEGDEARQASEMQLADMALEEAEKKGSAIQAVEREVIPIYESAYEMNPDSPLAGRIQEKITSLQKKYALLLFQLRNGRPTTLPRHFLRIAQEYGYDDNIVYAPTETTVTKSDTATTFAKTEAMGRYTFYYKDFISVAPEMRANYTHHFHRIPSIYSNDNYLLAPALRTTYEHDLFGKPASVLFDYEYNEVQRDINAEKKLEFASRSHALMLGERFSYFAAGDSTLRFKVRKFTSYLEPSNSNTLSLVYEQVIGLQTGAVLIYSSLDRTRVKTETFDSDALTVRGDWILPAWKEINPSLGLAVTLTDPVNDRDNRGLEKLINPGLRLNRRLGKNWGLNFRLEHYRNISKDEENFAYKKTLGALELEYLF